MTRPAAPGPMTMLHLTTRESMTTLGIVMLHGPV